MTTEKQLLAGHDQAMARSHAYQLLGQLFLRGLTPDLLPYVRSVPDLAAALPGIPDPDETAAAHQHLFGFNVFPFESIFLGTDNLLGGPVTERVLESYGDMGFYPDQADHSADHVGTELGFLSFLCGAEADAIEDDQPNATQGMRSLQQDFLDKHLLCWLPALVQSIHQQTDRSFGRASEVDFHQFFAGLADLTLETVLAHRAELATHGFAAAAQLELPPSPNLLDNDKTGLADIARFLITPAYSGFYLSRDDVGQLAQLGGLPRGFGDRQNMLVNVLRVAGKYQQLTEILDSLKRLVNRWRTMYTSPPVAAHVFMDQIATAWQEKLANTSTLLDELEAVIRDSHIDLS